MGEGQTIRPQKGWTLKHQRRVGITIRKGDTWAYVAKETICVEGSQIFRRFSLTMDDKDGKFRRVDANLKFNGRNGQALKNQKQQKQKENMTICIAAICEQSTCLVLAADAMITSHTLSVEFEHPKRKMTSLSDRCVALTAGDALAHTELFNVAAKGIEALREPAIAEIAEKMTKCYQDIRKNKITEKILIPIGFESFKEFARAQQVLMPDVVMRTQQKIERFNYGLDIIIAGTSDDKAHIYGISDPGTSLCFDAIGFHAIGSGLPHALNTLIARSCNQDTALADALLIVYESKKIAEKAPGVGTKRTDVCIVTPEKKIEFSEDKIEALDEIYLKWTSREANWKNGISNLLESLGVTNNEDN